jgi:spectinomycin phosphotransferase
MLDKPSLKDEKIIACLRASYGLSVTELEFRPLGKDSHAGVYRVQANRRVYFLKVKSDSLDEISVLLPRYLKEQGMEPVIAPLPTNTQDLWTKIDSFTLTLYPCIEGRSGWEAGLSDSQWVEFGAVLKQLHATRLPLELLNRMPRETFTPDPKWMAIIERLHAAVRDRVYDDPFEKQLAVFWKDHYDEIGVNVDRAGQLGRMLQNKSFDLVLCHADIHTANLLVPDQGNLFIVDWDQPILAPRERDLMFVTVGAYVTEQRAETLFFRGYGKTEIDPLAMAYYRYARVVEDLGGFAEPVFFMDASDETKMDSVKWFMAQFAPGGLVEVAHKLDHVLPMLD